MVLALLTAGQFQRFLSKRDRFAIFPGAVKLADTLVERGEVIRLRAGRTGRRYSGNQQHARQHHAITKTRNPQAPPLRAKRASLSHAVKAN